MLKTLLESILIIIDYCAVPRKLEVIKREL